MGQRMKINQSLSLVPDENMSVKDAKKIFKNIPFEDVKVWYLEEHCSGALRDILSDHPTLSSEWILEVQEHIAYVDFGTLRMIKENHPEVYEQIIVLFEEFESREDIEAFMYSDSPLLKDGNNPEYLIY